MPKRKGKLTVRERAFVTAFLGDARGNGTTAAKLAGFTGKNARHYASRLMTKANIQEAIAERVNRKEAQDIADADERDRVLSEFMRNAGVDVKERIAAVKELNKVTGRHSVQVNVKGKLTLEEALGLSRADATK